jgi:hypothetical protein
MRQAGLGWATGERLTENLNTSHPGTGLTRMFWRFVKERSAAKPEPKPFQKEMLRAESQRPQRQVNC